MPEDRTCISLAKFAVNFQSFSGVFFCSVRVVTANSPKFVIVETEQMLFHSSLDMQHLEIGVKSMNSEIGKT